MNTEPDDVFFLAQRPRDRLRGVDWRDSSPAIDRGLLERFVTAITANDIEWNA